MPKLQKNLATGEYRLVGDDGTVIPGASIKQHKQTGQILALDSNGTPLASYNPSTNASLSVGTGSLTEDQAPPPGKPVEQAAQEDADARNGQPEEDGPVTKFAKGFYNTRFKPMIDAAKDAYERGDLGAHQFELLANGFKDELGKFAASGGDMRHLPIIGPMSQDIAGDLNKGEYSSALGKTLGFISPGLEGPVLDKAGKLANKGADFIKSKAIGTLQKAFPKSAQVLPEDIAAAAGDVEGPRSVGQLTQNSFANRLEGSHGGRVATDLAEQQRQLTNTRLQKMKQALFGGKVPENPNLATQQRMAENFFTTADRRTKLYQDFEENHVNQNVAPITITKANPDFVSGNATTDLLHKINGIEPTITTTKNAVGPVILYKALPILEDMRAKLEPFYNGENFQRLPDISKGKFNLLKNTLDELTQKTDGVVNGTPIDLPIHDYEVIKQLRTDIGKKLSRLQDFGIQDAQLTKLKSLLGDDLLSSVGGWKNGKQAVSDLQEANAFHEAFKTTFNDKIKDKLFAGNSGLSRGGKNMVDPVDIYNGVAESPVAAKKFMEALGPKNASVAKGAIFSKLADASIDKASGTFSPDKMINAFQSPGYREIFTNAERTQAEYALRQFRTMRPEDLVSRGGGLSKAGIFHLALPAIGIASGLATGHLALGLQAGVAMEIGLGQFTKRILLDPKYARMAAKLPYVQAGSAESGMLSRQLMKALKGTSVSVLMPNGDKEDAKIDDKGELEK